MKTKLFVLIAICLLVAVSVSAGVYTASNGKADLPNLLTGTKIESQEEVSGLTAENVAVLSVSSIQPMAIKSFGNVGHVVLGAILFLSIWLIGMTVDKKGKLFKVTNREGGGLLNAGFI